MTPGKFIWGLRIRTLPVAEPLNHVLQTALAVVKVLFWFAILSSYHPIATAHKWALDPAGAIPNSPDCIPGARDHAIRGGQREEEPLPAQMSLCGFRLDLSCFILKPFSSQLEGGDSVALSSMVWTEDTVDSGPEESISMWAKPSYSVPTGRSLPYRWVFNLGKEEREAWWEKERRDITSEKCANVLGFRYSKWSKKNEGRFLQYLFFFLDVNNIIVTCDTLSIRQRNWFVHGSPLDFLISLLTIG